MTAIYDGLGIPIRYPENWQITDEHTLTWPKSVSVQSPHGAFWCVFLYPPGACAEDVSDEVLRAMRVDYSELDATPVQQRIAGQNACGYDVEFYCMDLIIRAQIRCFALPDSVCLLMYQAEDRDFSELETVFSAITSSMLADLAK
jgi:hypothetical protein